MKSIVYLVYSLVFVSVGIYASVVSEAIHDLGLEVGSWELLGETEDSIVWIMESGVVVTLNVDPRVGPELEEQDPIERLRRYYREEAQMFGAGLVEVETRSVGEFGLNLVTMKFRLRDLSPEFEGSNGFGYQINAILPTEERTYVIQLADLETGTTGVREAIVMGVLVANSESRDMREVSERFRRDPYDSLFDDTALYTLSDARKWDEGMPDHPLSRIRAGMDEILSGLKLDESIQDQAIYRIERLRFGNP